MLGVTMSEGVTATDLKASEVMIQLTNALSKAEKDVLKEAEVLRVVSLLPSHACALC